MVIFSNHYFPPPAPLMSILATVAVAIATVAPIPVAVAVDAVAVDAVAVAVAVVAVAVAVVAVLGEVPGEVREIHGIPPKNDRFHRHFIHVP